VRLRTHMRHIYVVSCMLATISLLAPAAKSQSEAEQEALARNCVAVSIDQCYRDGLIRLVNNTFIPDISKVLNDDQRRILKGVRFMIVADRDALGASAPIIDGTEVIRITSSVAYHISLFANAAALSVAEGADLARYLQYQDKAVGVLKENTIRAKQGHALLPTPSYAETQGLDQRKVLEFMRDPTFLGLNAYFAHAITYWVLAHEVGHHVLGHAQKLAREPGTPRKPMETAADDFAARILVRMGYSVYPVMFLMGYFAAIEEQGAGSPGDYPPAPCRLANVFDAAWSERISSNVEARDGANRQWNEVMDQPTAKQQVSSVLNGPLCRG
jgi:hypothetical protein